MNEKQSQLKALAAALLVTFLWSTSFILIKWGVKDIPPITFAGLRYSIAFISLLPFLLSQKNKIVVKSLTGNDWKGLLLLGIFFYALTQGTQFIGLTKLPAVTVSLWLNFTPLLVAVMAIFFVKELPSISQWIGVVIFLCGIMIYFLPITLDSGQVLGIIVVTVGVIANASSSVLGRKINREGRITPIIVTSLSMGIGSMILLITGFTTENFSGLSVENGLYLMWLAIINTAFAFTLWNYSLKILTAIESSIINGTMLIQITILAWIFLGEEISTKEIIGMLTAFSGILFVQMKSGKNTFSRR